MRLVLWIDDPLYALVGPHAHAEATRMLENVARHVRAGATDGRVTDINGNTSGGWAVVPEEPLGSRAEACAQACADDVRDAGRVAHVAEVAFRAALARFGVRVD
jgi:hypothetical protein